jgi:RNA polymerase sigma-70 factor (ECF subfamily)
MTFEGRIAEFLPRLRRFAQALSRNPSDADDLTQMTLERALRSQSRWKRGTRLDRWLYRIARNLWIDMLRQQARRKRLEEQLRELRQLVVDPRPGIEARIDLQSLLELMTRLPAKQREVLELVLVERVGYRECANMLRLPMGTVASRFTRGRSALLKMVGDRSRQ